MTVSIEKWNMIINYIFLFISKKRIIKINNKIEIIKKNFHKRIYLH